MTVPNRYQSISEGIPETIIDTDPTSSMRTKLKLTNSEIQNYVIALEKENLKLKKKITKYQEENKSLNTRIKASQENIKKEYNQTGGEIKLNVNVPHNTHKKSPT